MQCAQCRDLLSGHIDEELMSNETQDVEAHLAECAECAREHESLAATSQLLKQGLVRHSAPDVLKARIRNAIAQEAGAFDAPPVSTRSKYAQWVRLAAACAAVAVISSGVTYETVTRGGGPRGLADDIVTSHVRSLMAGHITDVVSNNTHTVKPWFNGKVDLSPTVPRLDSFPLLGGRVDYVEGHPVAAVVYSRRQHIINVYSWSRRGPNTDPVEVTGDKGYHLIEWRRDGIEQWAVSDLNTAELMDFARAFTASR
jgi:anti-sigma factor RsiW